jgi:hypothetical protein
MLGSIATPHHTARKRNLAFRIDVVRGQFQWGPRGESLEDCAQRAHEFLVELRSHFRVFSKWAVVHERPTNDLPALRFAVRSVRNHLDAGMNRHEKTGLPIRELGFRLSLLCRSSGWDLWSLKILCGVSSPRLFNDCTLECLDDTRGQGQLSRDDWVEVIHTITRHWMPDAGSVGTPATSALGILERPHRVGWITFVSRKKLKTTPVFPEGIEVTEVGKSGWIISAWPANFPDASKSELKAVKAIHAELKALIQQND